MEAMDRKIGQVYTEQITAVYNMDHGIGQHTLYSGSYGQVIALHTEPITAVHYGLDTTVCSLWTNALHQSIAMDHGMMQHTQCSGSYGQEDWGKKGKLC